jgi:hypothetical protein
MFHEREDTVVHFDDDVDLKMKYMKQLIRTAMDLFDYANTDQCGLVDFGFRGTPCVETEAKEE